MTPFQMNRKSGGGFAVRNTVCKGLESSVQARESIRQCRETRGDGLVNHVCISVSTTTLMKLRQRW